MKKQKPKLGDIFQIKLENSRYTYGQMLKNGIYAFYNFTSVDLPDLTVVTSSKPIFCILVVHYALERNIWPVIGNQPIPRKLYGTTRFCRFDMVSGQFLVSYVTDAGVYVEEKSTLNECAQFEIEAVWEPEHVEDRLNDFYNGKEDRWVKSMRRRWPEM